MRLLLLSVLVFVTTIAQSQIKLNFFPEDILSDEELGQKCYCKPGVANKSRSRGLSISYGLANSGNYKAEGATPTFSTPTSSLNRLNHFEFKIKVPVVLKERTKVLLGYKYYLESYDFNAVGVDFSETFRTLDNFRLKSNNYSIILSHSLNEKNYLIFRYQYATNGNYDDWTSFDNKYAIHGFLGTYAIKKSEDFEWGVGLFYSNSFRASINFPIPFLLYNKNFNPKWGIEAMFPVNVFLRHNIGTASLATIGAEYNSKSFRLDVEDTLVPENLDYAYNHAAFLLSASWERHLTSWFWAKKKLVINLI